MGQRTYGKGSVQQVVPIGGDEEIKITVARYYTPSDTNIDKIGIPPDFEILYPELTEDQQKAYSDMMKDEAIEKYIENHPNMTINDIYAYAVQLKRTYNLNEKLLRRLVRIKAWRTRPSPLYDLDYDIQLTGALDILKENKDFKKLVASTKTLKELQIEAENSKSKED